MRRRDFIAALAGAALPPTARAQQPKVGLLSAASFDGPYATPAAIIRRGLQESGFVEGQNLTIESRAANGRYDRLPVLALQLVGRQAAVIVIIGVATPELAVAAAVAPVPFVFATASDAVEVGLVIGADRTAAGAANVGGAGAAATRLDLLLELVPRVNAIGYLDNSRLPAAFEANVRDVTAAAGARGRDVAIFDAGNSAEIERAFTYMALQQVRALVVSADPFLAAREEQIIAAAEQSRIATIYAMRDAAVHGGLMSYSVVADDMYRLAGIYAGQILQGAPPTASPAMLPTRFEFVINSRTAEALRRTVPRRLQIRADEIIG